MLLFDDGKKLEKAVGEEAAKTIVEVLERFDERCKEAPTVKQTVGAFAWREGWD